MMEQNKNNIKSVNMFFKAAAAAFLLSSAVLALCVYNSSFAQMYSDTVSVFLRYLLSAATGFLPFSVAEVCLLLLPFAIIFALVVAVRAIVKKRFSIKKVLLSILGVLFVAFSVFVNVFGVCYFTKPLEVRLDLNRTILNRDELYKDALYTHGVLCGFADNVDFDKGGASVNPHSFFETGKLVDKGYDALSDSSVFKSKMVGKSKPVMLSSLMTYTHISGMYMPFTGEANVNTNYPDYVVAFTIAHEKAHQRGVASEDEANFMAFLACMASGDNYLKYSAMMNMYDYYLDETLENDVKLYNQLVGETDSRIIGEMYAYFKFFKKYSGSAASKAANTVNDTYIKAMGNDEGVKSYGLVIELYHAYIEKMK